MSSLEYHFSSVQSIARRYDPENDCHPEGPLVTYPEMVLLEAVQKLIVEVGILNDRIMALEVRPK